MKQPLILQPASMDDCETLFNWRNHPLTRQHSNETQEIQWETHCVWLKETLVNPQRVLLIASKTLPELDEEGIGVLRFDLQGTQALVSIYLAPEKIGQGYGTNLLQTGAKWIQEQYPSIETLVAEIRSGNAASVHSFKKAGYQINQSLSNQEILRYEQRL
jgi:UDP-2,4-diacetamido-2,4,6-trideoxy-beta-L-altropyranose hydrolase